MYLWHPELKTFKYMRVFVERGSHERIQPAIVHESKKS